MKNRDDNIVVALNRCLNLLFEGGLSDPFEVDGQTFVAKLGTKLFDLVTIPEKINGTKLKTALTNEYSVEIIYVVPGKILTNHSSISYRYIGEYVNEFKRINVRSDLLRLISEFRNSVEESYVPRRSYKNK